MFSNQVKKMNCDEISGKLSPYQDKELRADVRTGIEKHLSVCEECRRELEELEMITADISSLQNIEPLLNFDAGVMSKVIGYEEKKYSGKLAFVYSFVFTLFFIFGIFIEPFSHNPLPEPEINPELSFVLLDGQKFTSEDHQNSVVLQLTGEINEQNGI